jgi:hypothetical protein
MACASLLTAVHTPFAQRPREYTSDGGSVRAEVGS